MNDSSYTASDLILNPEFRDWVANPSDSSNAYWESWIRQNPEKIEEVKQAKKRLREFPLEYNQLHDDEVEAMWLTLKQQANNELTEKDTPTIKIGQVANTATDKKDNQFWKKTRRWAAAVVMLIGTLVGLALFNMEKSKQTNVTQKVAMVNKINTRGQKSTIYLKDGSRVILNSNSKLTYPEKFAAGNRTVFLEGEAFFEVAKDSDNPFKVITGNLSTIALGTSFNINMQQEEIHVALATGKVLVLNNASDQESTSVLVPGEDIRYNKKSKKVVKGRFDPDLTLGWKEKTIVFKRASEEAVFNYLENWYDVDIEVKNESSLVWDYSGEFDNMDLNSVLLSIGFTMKFDYKLKGNEVKISYK